MSTRDWVGTVAPETARRLLLGTIDAAAATVELDALAARVAELVTGAMSVDVCFVHVLDDDERHLTLAGATPPFDAQVGKVHLAVSEGVAGWVAAHRAPAVIVEDKLSDPRYRYIPELRGLEYVSMASVPMLARSGGLAGVLNVHTRARREFGEEDVALLTGIGQLVAGAVDAARLHRRLLQRQHDYEQLVERFVAVQEEDRRRIAAEVHDGVTQAVVSLRMHLAAAADALPEAPDFAAEQLSSARGLADLALAEARAAVQGLRPPMLDDLGLEAALRALAASAVDVDVACELDPGALDEDAAPDHVQAALYRIAQEALQNVAKHAGASRVVVELTQNRDELVLRVRDDGEGFDEDAVGRGFGLETIRQRAALLGGSAVVNSARGRGTDLTVRLPVPVSSRTSGPPDGTRRSHDRG